MLLFRGTLAACFFDLIYVLYFTREVLSGLLCFPSLSGWRDPIRDPIHFTESVPVQLRIGAVDRMGIHLMTLKCQGTSHELRKRDRIMLMSHERMCQLSLRREARREIGYIRFAANLILRDLMIQARLTRIHAKNTHVAFPKDF